MLPTEQILESAARDGSIDIAEWSRVLEFLLQKLHDIVHNDFPIPSIPLPPPLPVSSTIDPDVVASTPPRIPTSETDTADQDLPDADNDAPTNSQSSTKENEAPVELAAGRPPSLPPLPPDPRYEVSDSQKTEEIEMPPPQRASTDPPPGTLPPELLSLYQMSRRVLEHDFAESPPYTIQRLAELVLQPKKHYRFLPAYLRALDRVVSVNSPVSDFPLQTSRPTLNGGFLTNGEAQVNGINEREGLGSDESLGGALLTPIPWLNGRNNMLAQATGSSEGELHSESTETIEGPHGAGSIETVSVTVNGIPSASASQTSSSPIASPTLSEQSDASTSSASSTEAQLREQGAVTQGELLRQEQEAGVVPVSNSGQPLTSRRTLLGNGAVAVGREVPPPASHHSSLPEEDEERPHARGPEVIGMEDMGPQPVGSSGVLDLDAAVGRRSKSPQPPPPQHTTDEDDFEPGKPGKDPSDVEMEVEKLREAMDREQAAEVRDADGDVMVADANGDPVGPGAPQMHGGEPGADAVDTTGL